MELPQTVSAVLLAGVFAAGAAIGAADPVLGQFEVDGVTITSLVSEDYMPPPPPE